MFKAGEKVIHHRYGEGVLSNNNQSSKEEFPLFFDSYCTCCVLTSDGKQHKDDLYPSIYYVPQTLDMSKPEPEIGTWGYFWDEGYITCNFGKLIAIVDKKYKYEASYHHKGPKLMYQHFSPEIPPHIKELMNGTDTSNT